MPAILLDQSGVLLTSSSQTPAQSLAASAGAVETTCRFLVGWEREENVVVVSLGHESFSKEANIHSRSIQNVTRVHAVSFIDTLMCTEKCEE